MNLFNNIKFPAIILGSHRCGTTMLAQYISKIHNVKIFHEPEGISLHDPRPSIDDIIEFDKTSSNYVIRCFAQDFFQSHLRYQKLDLSKYYLIRIRRKNVVDRITSLYVAYTRKNWYYSSKTSSDEIYQTLFEPISVDIDRIKKFIRATVEWDHIHANIEYHLDIKLNADVYYEDIDMNKLSSINSEIMPKPSNYQELREIVFLELEKHLANRP